MNANIDIYFKGENSLIEELTKDDDIKDILPLDDLSSS